MRRPHPSFAAADLGRPPRVGTLERGAHALQELDAVPRDEFGRAGAREQRRDVGGGLGVGLQVLDDLARRQASHGSEVVGVDAQRARQLAQHVRRRRAVVALDVVDVLRRDAVSVPFVYQAAQILEAEAELEAVLRYHLPECRHVYEILSCLLDFWISLPALAGTYRARGFPSPSRTRSYLSNSHKLFARLLRSRIVSTSAGSSMTTRSRSIARACAASGCFHRASSEQRSKRFSPRC